MPGTPHVLCPCAEPGELRTSANIVVRQPRDRRRRTLGLSLTSIPPRWIYHHQQAAPGARTFGNCNTVCVRPDSIAGPLTARQDHAPGSSTMRYPRSMKLECRLVEKAWRRTSLAAMLTNPRRLPKCIDEAKETRLVDSAHFVLIHCHSDRLEDRRRWVLRLSQIVRCEEESAGPGECLLLEAVSSSRPTMHAC